MVEHHDQSPTGLQDPVHLRDRAFRVGRVVQHSHRRHAVEGAIGPRQVLGAAHHELARQVRQLEAPSRQPDAGLGEIDPRGDGTLAGELAEDVPVAATDVEHALPGERPVLVELVRELEGLVRLAQPVVVREVLRAAELVGHGGRRDRVLLPVRADVVDSGGRHATHPTSGPPDRRARGAFSAR